jgi:uncharacterized membrane protein YphA (DoxX/SURF4 family)
MFKPSIPNLSVAMVWIYQGLCKLAQTPRQRAILESVPHLNPTAALTILGAVECTLGVWILSARQPRAAAAAQTALLVAMNAGGILWGGSEIPDIPGMLLLNFALLVLAWTAANQGATYAHR